ncbi:MAG: hypothetical protein JWR12_1426 [Mucilaginibacter sp.]|jgi:hypothetical protein|nr:hypothetical protein [Mucilaginibacter sp.]
MLRRLMIPVAAVSKLLITLPTEKINKNIKGSLSKSGPFFMVP